MRYSWSSIYLKIINIDYIVTRSTKRNLFIYIVDLFFFLYKHRISITVYLETVTEQIWPMITCSNSNESDSCRFKIRLELGSEYKLDEYTQKTVLIFLKIKNQINIQLKVFSFCSFFLIYRVYYFYSQIKLIPN